MQRILEGQGTVPDCCDQRNCAIAAIHWFRRQRPEVHFDSSPYTNGPVYREREKQLEDGEAMIDRK